MFYPDYKREPRNSMKWFVGARRWLDSSKSVFPSRLSPSVRVHPLATFLLVIRSTSVFRRPLDFHHAERWSITHLPLPWNAQETRVSFVMARNDGALLIALFTISFHTTRVCVLFISRGTSRKTYPCFAKLHGFRKICDATCKFWKLLLQVTFYISETLGCNDGSGGRTKFVILKSILRTISYLSSCKLWACKFIFAVNPTYHYEEIIELQKFLEKKLTNGAHGSKQNMIRELQLELIDNFWNCV